MTPYPSAVRRYLASLFALGILSSVQSIEFPRNFNPTTYPLAIRTSSLNTWIDATGANGSILTHDWPRNWDLNQVRSHIQEEIAHLAKSIVFLSQWDGAAWYALTMLCGSGSVLQPSIQPSIFQS